MTDELDTRWHPLDVRESGDYAAYDALHPGVPTWLEASLWGWVEDRVRKPGALLEIERVLRIDLDHWGDGKQMLVSLKNRVLRDREVFLRVVDYLLSRLDTRPVPPTHPQYGARLVDTGDFIELMRMLQEAGSLWTVEAVAGQRFGLQRRVSSAVEATAKQVMGTGDKAAQHLRLAWNAVYGRHPDAGKGYGEAIKAMEVATIPVVCPSNTRATLNRVINDLRAKPSKWAVNLKHPTPDRQVEIVADTLDLIWKGQSDRHGDPDPNAPISVELEEAEAAVHLAVTVVHWFTTGVVTTN